MASSLSTPVCSIEDRRGDISTEHNATYKRINLSHEEQEKLLIERLTEPPGLDERWMPFAEWLQDDEQLVYWITGHPRSGKSTLMRFLHDDKIIQNRVRMWADGSRVVKVPFFLRKPTSYRALLENMLYGALDGRKLFQDLLHDLRNKGLPDEELVKVFESAFCQLVYGEHGKFLFMIDGVEHMGDDAQKLWKFLGQHKPAGRWMKVCVSSLFFKQMFEPSVRMEILTRVDIRHNISNELDNSRWFCRLRNNEPGLAQGIMRHIADRADGSFLYARLATAWVFGKIVEEKKVPDLPNQLPATSDEIFEDLLKRNFSPGLSTAKLFGLIHQAEHTKKPLSLIVLSYVEELEDKPIKSGTKATTSSEIDERANKMNRNLYYRSGGLLEAPDFADVGAPAQVRYHETATEWKTHQRKYVNDYMRSLGSKDIDRTLCTELCLAYLRRIKSLDPKQPTFFMSFRRLATACLEYSFKIEKPPDEPGTVRATTNRDIILALDKDAETLLEERQPHSERFYQLSHTKESPRWYVKVQGHHNSYSTIRPHWTNVCDIDNYQPPSLLFDFALQHNLHSVVEYYLPAHENQRICNGNGNGNGNISHGAEKPPPNGKTRKQKKREKREKARADEKEKREKERKMKKLEKRIKKRKNQLQDAVQEEEELKKLGQDLAREKEETNPVHKLIGGRILPLTLIARSQHSKGNPAPISVKMAEILIERGADPNYDESSEAPGGNTPWHALLKAMASEMPKPPKNPSTTDKKRPSTADGQPKTDKEVEAERKARCEELLADQDRRCRLTQLAILFLNKGADSYATVRAMPPPSEPDSHKGPSSRSNDEFFIWRLARRMNTRAKKDDAAAVTAAPHVPGRIENARTQWKAMKELTRDVDSAKLTLDQIIEAVEKLDVEVRDEINDIGTTEQKASMKMPDWAGVTRKMKNCRKADEAEKGYIFRERVWERVKLFAR